MRAIRPVRATGAADMSYANRRAAFAHLLACYHNSFAESAGVIEHSPGYIQAVVEAADDAVAGAALRLDPRLTSTAIGAVAYSVAKAIAEDKGLAKEFVDIELSGDILVAYFEEKAEPERIKRVLSELGKVGVLAKPGDRISENVTADAFIIVLEPAKDVSEAVVAAARARFAVTEQTDLAPAPAPAAAATTRPGSAYDGLAECAHLDLPAGVFADLALAGCPAEPSDVVAVFEHLFGAAALKVVRESPMGASRLDEGDEYGLRNRLLRVMAAKGALSDAGNPVAEATAKAVADAAAAGTEVSLDDVAVALDPVLEGDLLAAEFVRRLVDLGAEPLSEERRAALTKRVTDQVVAEATGSAATAKVLTAVARVALAGAGHVAIEEGARVLAAWDDYTSEDEAEADAEVVEEAAPAPVVAADPLAGLVDALLGA